MHRNSRPEPTWRQRNTARLRYAADLLEAIHQRLAHADASTALPPRRPQQRTSGTYTADPTAITAADRDQIFRATHEQLGDAVRWLETVAAQLRHWAPNPTASDRCDCPDWCCDDCPKPRIDGRIHPTCRSRMSRMRRKAESESSESSSRAV